MIKYRCVKASYLYFRSKGNISIALSSQEKLEKDCYAPVSKDQLPLKYEFNAPFKLSLRRVDNLLPANKHLFLTIGFRNKERARNLHLNSFHLDWLTASSPRVPAVRQQPQTKGFPNPHQCFIPWGRIRRSYYSQSWRVRLLWLMLGPLRCKCSFLSESFRAQKTSAWPLKQDCCLLS